jgi:hypothetical protein
MLDPRLPCLTCSSPQALDVRHQLAQGALHDDDAERNTTPSGLPLACCRVRQMGEVPSSIPGKAR